MKAAFISLCSVFTLASAWSLDLTPRQTIARSEGGDVKRYYFDDAGKKLGFRLDRNMSIDGSGGEASIRIQGIELADMKISKSLLNGGIPFVENLPRYRELARHLLPGEATDVVANQEQPDVVPINDWTSYQFVFTYNLYGRSFRTSITFMNYDAKEQLIINTGAPIKDYDKVYILSYRVLNSLYELRIGEEVKPTGKS